MNEMELKFNKIALPNLRLTHAGEKHLRLTHEGEKPATETCSCSIDCPW